MPKNSKVSLAGSLKQRQQSAGFTLPNQSVRAAALAPAAVEDETKLGVDVILKLLPAGTLLDFGGATPPDGYLICDGSSLLKADYPALYAAIGDIWGTADADHFNLPDFRGRTKRGWANGSANDPDRTTRTANATGGATGDNVGSVQNDQMQRITGQGNDIWTVSNVFSGAISKISSIGIRPNTGGNVVYHLAFDSANSPNAKVSSTTSGETRMKNAYVNIIIKY